MTPRGIIVVGATGGAGRQVVEQALAAGYEVTALVRDAGRLPERQDRLRVVVGTLPEAPAFRDAGSPAPIWRTSSSMRSTTTRRSARSSAFRTEG